MPHGYAVEDATPPRGFPMILDTDIHNFYEHLVLKEIEKQGWLEH